MIRFVHSFSTRSACVKLGGVDSVKRLLGNVVYYATSLMYLKRLGQEVVLYTDTLGKALLGYLPYDHIYDVEIPDNVSPRFWAAPKMWALEQEPLESVHIDGDVFIKTQKCLDAITQSDWDILVQMYESAEWYEQDCSLFNHDKEFCAYVGLNPNGHGAYNNGVIGFRNEELKHTFINGYKALATHFSEHHIDKLAIDATPDLIAEQRFVYQLAQNKGAKVHCLLGSDYQHDANELGYQHVLTASKYRHLEKCLAVLEKLSEETYNKTYKLCQSILKK